VEDFRKLCEEYALSQVKNQAEQFLRLGVFSDPKTNYVTLNPEYEISELRLFQQMFHQGLIYRALKPIY
jgi:isoleucyl-tRNA synthetase